MQIKVIKTECREALYISQQSGTGTPLQGIATDKRGSHSHLVESENALHAAKEETVQHTDHTIPIQA